MKKTFQLRPEGKNPDRVLEAIKHEIRKYVQRERRRVPPKGSDYWDFDCRFGTTEDSAETVHLGAISKLMDGVAAAEGPQFYVEILAKPARFKPRPEGETGERQAPHSEDDGFDD